MKAFEHIPLSEPPLEASALIGWVSVGLVGALYLEFTSLHEPLLKQWIVMITFLCLRRMPGTLKQGRLHRHLLQQKIKTLPLKALESLQRSRPEDRYLGDGFDWRPQHAQWAHELLASGGPRGAKGSGWVHQLSFQHRALSQPLSETEGHTLIVGTTGAGKTRTFDLLIAQAIARGEAVIILDPKGDRDLRASAQRMLKALGREKDLVIFHPAFPDQSVRLDPLRNFNRPSELSSRIAGAIPSSHPSDPFKAFGQRALDQIIQGLLFLSVRPSLIEVRRILEGGPEGLVRQALEHHFKNVLGVGWKARIPQGIRGRTTSSGVNALAAYYRDQMAPSHAALPLEGLLALYEHDRNHFGKMVASLLPVMNLLTNGPLEQLLSPDLHDRDDLRPITDLGRIIERKQVAYIGLDALSDGPAAAMVGSLLLSDLTAVAGERYNAGTANDPVHVFIDEAAEVINEPCIQLLNKGRGAGIRMTIATQTLADFSARMGSEARALQVLGNVNNLIALRVMDAETQKFVTRNLPTFRRRTILRTLGNTTLGPEPHQFSGNLGERLIEEDAELFPSALLGQLPDLHFLGKLAGGRIIKGRIPLLVESSDA